MKTPSRHCLLVLLSVSLACQRPSVAPSTDEVLSAAVEAIGGTERLSAANTLSYQATGTRYDSEQSFSITAGPQEMSDFKVAQSLRLTDLAEHGEWTCTSRELMPGTIITFTETAGNEDGFVDGKDNLFGGSSQRPMLSSQVAARRKDFTLSSPSFLLKWGLDHRSQTTSATVSDAGTEQQVVTLTGVPGSVAPIQLWLDPSNNLPQRATTVEDDPVHGDVLVEVRYENWQVATEGLQVPTQLTHRYNGATVQTLKRHSVSQNVTLPPDTFEVPTALRGTIDPALARRGDSYSQYLLRVQGILVPQYADVSPLVTETDLGNDIVFYSTGLYNTLAVATPRLVVVLEAPLYESVSQAVIAKIKARWPNKPIQYVVNTHFHFDHAGGLRAYAAEGAEVLVAEPLVKWFDDSMKAPHTLVPDALARNPRTVTVTGVADRKTIADGARRITLYNIKQSHSDGHLIAHIEDASVLFVTDLYAPGSAGPNPMGPAPGVFGRNAKDLLAALASVGLDETNVKIFVGGHGGAQGSFQELRIFAR